MCLCAFICNVQCAMFMLLCIVRVFPSNACRRWATLVGPPQILCQSVTVLQNCSIVPLPHSSTECSKIWHQNSCVPLPLPPAVLLKANPVNSSFLPVAAFPSWCQRKLMMVTSTETQKYRNAFRGFSGARAVSI